MACYFESSISGFLDKSPSELLGLLTLRHASDGFSEMRADVPLTWWDDLDSLREAFSLLLLLSPEAESWQVVMEFTIPRKMRRLDVVLLTPDAIIIIECKTGKASAEARRQVEDYALLLHYFHKPSHERLIIPILVSRLADQVVDTFRQKELEFPSLPSIG